MFPLGSVGCLGGTTIISNQPKNETLFHVVSSSKGNIFTEIVDFQILLCWIAHVMRTVVLQAF